MDYKRSVYKPVKPFFPFTYWERTNTGARDITKRYQRGLNYDPSCKLYLPFYKHGKNETTIYDQSGHGNNATISGAVAGYPPMASGGELVLTRDMSSSANWTAGADWSIGAGVATKVAGGATALEQDISATANHIFSLTYTMTRTAGTLTPSIGGVNGTARALAGTYTENIRTTGTGNLKFTADAAFAGTVDDVSVTDKSQIGGYCDGTNDRFTLSNVFTTNQIGLTILSWVYCHSFASGLSTEREMIYANWAVAVPNKGFFLRAKHNGDDLNNWNLHVCNGTTGKTIESSILSDAVFASTYQNKWLCVCGSFEASTRMKLWINGSAATSDVTAGVLNLMSPNTATSDYLAFDADKYFNVTYGELVIFNRAFSDTEFRNYYEITRRKYT